MALPGYDLYKDKVPGLERTTGGMGGDIPHQKIRGFTVRFYKRLYKSEREKALLLDKTFRGGYGVLEIGTVLAVDQNDTDKLVPYTPDTIALTDVSRVFLLTDCTTADNFYVEMYESYKLAVGDVIKMTDTDGTYEEATISTIDRTTYDTKALVTLSGATSGTYTIAKNANCYVKAQDSATGTKASKAVYVLDMEVDTGAGEDASGGSASVFLSNAILYTSDLVGMDAQARTDLSNVTVDGIYHVFK